MGASPRANDHRGTRYVRTELPVREKEDSSESDVRRQAGGFPRICAPGHGGQARRTDESLSVDEGKEGGPRHERSHRSTETAASKSEDSGSALSARRVFRLMHSGTRTPNELEQQVGPTQSEDSTTISTMKTGGCVTTRAMPKRHNSGEGPTTTNGEGKGSCSTCPIFADIKGTRSRPSTCGCQRRLTRNARTKRDVSRRLSRIKGRAITNGAPPNNQRAYFYQPNDRGGQVGRADDGAVWLHPTLIDINRDQILSISKQAQKVATRLMRTEGGSQAERRSTTILGGRHRWSFHHKEGGTSWNGLRSDKGTGSSSALAAGTPGTAREGGPARVRRTRRCRRSKPPSKFNSGVCPSALFKPALRLLAWCVHDPFTERRDNC